MFVNISYILREKLDWNGNFVFFLCHGSLSSRILKRYQSYFEQATHGAQISMTTSNPHGIINREDVSEFSKRITFHLLKESAYTNIYIFIVNEIFLCRRADDVE